jgi:menaquinone-dependent protoporphyrinogen oxidase
MGMNVLVIYASRLGATRGIAERIAETLAREGIEVAARPVDHPGDLRAADAFVIGSGIYGGHWPPEAVEFVRRRRDVLAARPVWLFSSGPVGNAAVRRGGIEPKEAGELRELLRPREHRIFAGALDRSTVDGSGLSMTERLVAKTLIPAGDYRDWAAITAWAVGIARELSRVPAVIR